ncbi:MAG TPA: hypothetical protein VGR57_03275 [Ktedonobacterales bacterium]|nr:hypothetical protein [Ktedonobacterales bacterium]
MDHLLKWLFTDPQTACADATAANKVCAAIPGATSQQFVEVFHFYVPWLIFCALGVLIPIYYNLEGRKRFVKGNMLLKRNLDRFMDHHLPWLGGVGLMLIAFRYAADSAFLSWRAWRYAWLAWGLGIAIFWGYYLVRRFPKERAYYQRYHTLMRYVPQPRKRRPVARAGSR